MVVIWLSRLKSLNETFIESLRLLSEVTPLNKNISSVIIKIQLKQIFILIL